MPESVLFLTLRVFSATGGIEKVCRILGKALFEKSIQDFSDVRVISSHDYTRQAIGNPYFPSERFRGFSGSKWRFMLSAIWRGIGKSQVIISHINLLPAGWVIRLFSPRTRLILLAHGIEVWDMPLGLRKYMLRKCSLLICVSGHTKTQMISMHKIPADRCMVLNNCLDPYLPVPLTSGQGSKIRERHGIEKKDTLLFTLTRMKSSERYKGYDRVIDALSEIKSEYPSIKYLIAGKYDDDEVNYVKSLAAEKELHDQVILAGYIDDKDIPAYFQSADIFIMPSYKEGFGIAFIEAMYYGIPVIAGNKDGSVDALGGGEFGLLVDPHDARSIAAAIRKIMKDRSEYLPDRDKLLSRFGYPAYRERLFKAMTAD